MIAGREGEPRVLYVSAFVSRSSGNMPYCELLADRFEGTGISVTRTSSRAGRAVRVCDAVATVARKARRHDVVLVDLFSTAALVWGAAAVLLAARMGKPVVVALHGGGLAERAARQPGRIARVLRTASAVVTPSRRLRDRLQPLCPIPIEVLPNGIDLDRFPFRLRRRAEPRLVWVRALHRMYRPWLAVEALAAVRRTHPAATLTIVGPDKGDGSRTVVEAAIERTGTAKAVTLRGPVANELLHRELDGADVFLNTTSVESFGVSVMEAAASGLCIVTSDAGELSHLWRHDHDALLESSEDGEAYGRHVGRIVGDPELAARLSSNAREKAESCGWPRILAEWDRVLGGVRR